MNSKKIVIATGIYPPDIGGPAFFAMQFASELTRRNIPTLVVSYGPSGVSRSWPRGIRHAIYFFKLFFVAFGARGIIALDSLGAGLPALFVSWILRKRLVLRLGGDFLWEKYVNLGNAVTLRAFYDRGLHRKFSMLFLLARFVLRRVDALVFTTKFQRDIFVRHYGLSSAHVRVIGNVFQKLSDVGGPASVFHPRSSDVRHRTFLWAGRMIPLKNLPLLIRVFQKLHAIDSSLRLRLVGDGSERERIATLIASLQLSDSVTLVSALSDAALDEEIRGAYCVVLPSLTEISPNFALRSLALGTPVVLTSETGIREQFPELYYVDPLNERDFFTALQRLLELRTYEYYRQTIVAFSSQLSWVTVVDRYLQLL